MYPQPDWITLNSFRFLHFPFSLLISDNFDFIEETYFTLGIYLLDYSLKEFLAVIKH